MGKLLYGTGFVLIMIGAAGMDSPSLVAPVSLMVIGAVLIGIASYESGELRKRK